MSERKISLEDDARCSARQNIMQALPRTLSPTLPTPRVPRVSPPVEEGMSQKPAMQIGIKAPSQPPPPLSPRPPRSPRTSPTNRSGELTSVNSSIACTHCTCVSMHCLAGIRSAHSRPLKMFLTTCIAGSQCS
jgi:hypothetical protein